MGMIQPSSFKGRQGFSLTYLPSFTPTDERLPSLPSPQKAGLIYAAIPRCPPSSLFLWLQTRIYWCTFFYRQRRIVSQFSLDNTNLVLHNRI